MIIVVKEMNFHSIKTDALLYNGQPTTNIVNKPSSLGLCRGAKKECNSQPTNMGTGCHSVGVATSTSSNPKNKDGVSVENAHSTCVQELKRIVLNNSDFLEDDIMKRTSLIRDSFCEFLKEQGLIK